MIDPAIVNAAAKALRKPHVNGSCIGCAACIAISGDVFEFDDNGLSVVRPLPSYEDLSVDDSISACPVNAICWQKIDENGNYANGVVEHGDPIK